MFSFQYFFLESFIKKYTIFFGLEAHGAYIFDKWTNYNLGRPIKQEKKSSYTCTHLETIIKFEMREQCTPRFNNELVNPVSHLKIYAA